MAFAIKAEVCNPREKMLAFTAQKTMYGGKRIAEGDTVFVFASENEGGQGLIARGVVTSVEAIAKKSGIIKQTPRVSLTLRDVYKRQRQHILQLRVRERTAHPQDRIERSAQC